MAFGYPAASPYNGLNMVEDIGAMAGQDGNISGANGTRPIVIGKPDPGKRHFFSWRHRMLAVEGGFFVRGSEGVGEG